MRFLRSTKTYDADTMSSGAGTVKNLKNENVKLQQLCIAVANFALDICGFLLKTVIMIFANVGGSSNFNKASSES